MRAAAGIREQHCGLIAIRFVHERRRPFRSYGCDIGGRPPDMSKRWIRRRSTTSVAVKSARGMPSAASLLSYGYDDHGRILRRERGNAMQTLRREIGGRVRCQIGQ